MSLEQTLFQALGPLVGDRVHAVTFPQNPATPITPAILFNFVSDTTAPDICGAGEADVADTRIQVDIFSVDFDTARALRLQVIEALSEQDPPVVWEGGFTGYEPALKLHRQTLEFTFYPSSS